MIPLPDPDCNRVTMTASPNVTLRCVMPEGHVEPCDPMRANIRVTAHRLPVETVTTVSHYRGRHRAYAGGIVADCANRVDASLRRQHELALAVGTGTYAFPGTVTVTRAELGWT